MVRQISAYTRVVYLSINAFSEWIIGIYLREFTNNEREISSPHEALPSTILKISRVQIRCTKKHFTETTIYYAGATVDNTQKHQLAWMKNLNFATSSFKTDIPQAVAFLVFLGIASSIRESVSESDKSSNFESADALV